MVFGRKKKAKTADDFTVDKMAEKLDQFHKAALKAGHTAAKSRIGLGKNILNNKKYKDNPGALYTALEGKYDDLLDELKWLKEWAEFVEKDEEKEEEKPPSSRTSTRSSSSSSSACRVDDSLPADGDDAMSRLCDFYEPMAPANVPRVPTIWESYKTRPNILYTKLLESYPGQEKNLEWLAKFKSKHGPDEAPIDYMGKLDPKTKGLARKLQAFYLSIDDPRSEDRAKTVPQVLFKNHGKEEEILNALRTMFPDDKDRLTFFEDYLEEREEDAKPPKPRAKPKPPPPLPAEESDEEEPSTHLQAQVKAQAEALAAAQSQLQAQATAQLQTQLRAQAQAQAHVQAMEQAPSQGGIEYTPQAQEAAERALETHRRTCELLERQKELQDTIIQQQHTIRKQQEEIAVIQQQQSGRSSALRHVSPPGSVPSPRGSSSYQPSPLRGVDLKELLEAGWAPPKSDPLTPPLRLPSPVQSEPATVKTMLEGHLQNIRNVHSQIEEHQRAQLKILETQDIIESRMAVPVRVGRRGRRVFRQYEEKEGSEVAIRHLEDEVRGVHGMCSRLLDVVERREDGVGEGAGLGRLSRMFSRHYHQQEKERQRRKRDRDREVHAFKDKLVEADRLADSYERSSHSVSRIRQELQDLSQSLASEATRLHLYNDPYE